MATPSTPSESIQFREGSVVHDCLLRLALEPSENIVTIGGRNYQVLGNEDSISSLREKKLRDLLAIPEKSRSPEQVRQIRETETSLIHLRAVQSELPTTDAILLGLPGVNSGKIKVSYRPDPKGKMHYQGGGAMILQKVIENATGESFSQVVKNQIFDKLGMDNSTYSSTEGSYSLGHDENGNPIPGGWRIYPEHAAAGLWSTPSDLAKIVIEIQKAYRGESERIIGFKLAQEMLTPKKGLGFAVPPIESASGSRYFFHEGQNAGFRCILVGNLNGQGAVIMTNGDNGEPLRDELLTAIASSYGWEDAFRVDKLEPLMNREEALSMNQREWGEKCVGTYYYSPHSNETVFIAITRREDKTFGQITVKRGDEISVETPFEISAVSPTRGCFRTSPHSPYQQLDVTLDSDKNVISVNIYGDNFTKMTAS